MKTDELFAYAGQILRINLSNGNISTEPSLNYIKEWLGSSGLAIKVLYDELKPRVTPYDPANRIIFGVGALVGTTAPGACKMTASALGPMIGGWASGASDSYVGGQLKYAGYDAVIIEGKAHRPVYLWINDDRVEIRDASRLWGKTTWETFEMIRDELRDSTLHTVSIGPAGENLARGACIIQDRGRAFGRCGTGAVMGSKNLKALVAKGTGAIRVADPERFMGTVKELTKRMKASKGFPRQQQYGSLGIFEGKQAACGVSYKNFQECKIPDDVAEEVLPTRTIDKYQIARSSFPGCPIGCGRVLHITEGPYDGLITECNQWEVMGTLQGRLAVREPTFMVKANAVCNQMGLDVDAAGGAIGWAMECYQRGILTEKDTDGLKLEWGDAGVALELIRKISYREGFGNILAEGCARAADIVGRDSSYYALHIKGQDLYEPCRGANAWALGTTTSTRGGGHTTGAPSCEQSGRPFDPEKALELYGVKNIDKPLEYEGKAQMVARIEVLHRVANCLGICHFNTAWVLVDYMGLPDMAELYSAATGWETSAGDLKTMADRQLNLEKAFNLRHTNFDRKDDLPTSRDLAEPIPTGNLAGWKIDADKYDKMLDHYYDLHGWDRETSFPTRNALADLDLEYVADDLEKIGKLR